MAFIFEGKHHRNPSGLYAKVKWFISNSKWDIIEIEKLYDKIWRNIVHRSEDNEMDGTTTRKALISWEKAVNICRLIINGKDGYPSYIKADKLADVKHKYWFIKLKDYYDTYISKNGIAREYFL